MTPTYDQVSVRLSEHMLGRGEWAGVPMPIEGLRLSIEDRYPYKGLEDAFTDETKEKDPEVLKFAEQLERGEARFVNEWHSASRRGRVYVYHKLGKAYVAFEPKRQDTMTLLDWQINSFMASWAWSLEAEQQAQERLRELVSKAQWRYYALTGAFMEQSKRSGVTYIFRRLKPTVALKGDEEGKGMRPLCALCLHPIAYYEQSFAGGMVPTDDVIAHLMLMRGDEHLYWRRANQHRIWTPNAGL